MDGTHHIIPYDSEYDIFTDVESLNLTTKAIFGLAGTAYNA
jgi:hypothetical protein